MKRLMICACAFAMLAALVAPAEAQEEESEARYVYSSYYYCDATRLGEVDELVEKMAPIYDAAKESGEIVNWGWGRHHTGGKWRRFFSGVGTDAVQLMDALDALAEKTGEIEGSEKFAEICGDHVDYVWRLAAGSPVSAADDPGEVGVSQYFKCTFNGEGFADDIVENHFSKVFNAHVGEGKLTSWAWGAHMIGGEYRRLLAMRAESRKAMLDTWGGIVQALGEEHAGALAQFNDICFAHEDYLWMTGR